MRHGLGLGIALAVGLGAVAAWQLRPAVPAPSPAAPVTAAASPPAVQAPAGPTVEPARPIVGYDRYRAEMRRVREAREQAQALQANERCIGGQRFRKVGTEWRLTGSC